MAKKKIVDRCKICTSELKEDLTLVYQLLVFTSRTSYCIGIQKILEELGNYAMEKGYHLSASQIILLRPDVLREYLQKKYPKEQIGAFILKENEICMKCYEEYCQMIPLK